MLFNTVRCTSTRTLQACERGARSSVTEAHKSTFSGKSNTGNPVNLASLLTREFWKVINRLPFRVSSGSSKPWSVNSYPRPLSSRERCRCPLTCTFRMMGRQSKSIWRDYASLRLNVWLWLSLLPKPYLRDCLTACLGRLPITTIEGKWNGKSLPPRLPLSRDSSSSLLHSKDGCCHLLMAIGMMRHEQYDYRAGEDLDVYFKIETLVNCKGSRRCTDP